MTCKTCGGPVKRRRAEADALRDVPLVYDDSRRPVNNKCPIDGSSVGHARRWTGGVRVRVFKCAQGHWLPA